MPAPALRPVATAPEPEAPDFETLGRDLAAGVPPPIAVARQGLTVADLPRVAAALSPHLARLAGRLAQPVSEARLRVHELVPQAVSVLLADGFGSRDARVRLEAARLVLELAWRWSAPGADQIFSPHSGGES